MNKDGRKVIATAKPGRKLRPGFVLTGLCMASDKKILRMVCCISFVLNLVRIHLRNILNNYNIA